MKIFLDTANLEKIKKYKDMIDGVTTNPSLIARESGDYRKIIKEIANIVNHVSVEVVSETYDEMIKEARELASISKNIVIKVPMTQLGMKVVSYLESINIRTNVTLVFTPIQALIAAKHKASFVSPFIGRLDDITINGLKLVEDIITIFKNYDIKTKIIAASVRHVMHVVELAKMGVDIVTMPPEVLEKLFHHPLTEIGIERFKRDWNKIIKFK